MYFLFGLVFVVTWAQRIFSVIDFDPTIGGVFLFGTHYVWKSLQQSDVTRIIWKRMSPQLCVRVMYSVCPVFLRHPWCLDSLKKPQGTYTPLLQRHNGIPCRSREPVLAAGWSGCFSSLGSRAEKYKSPSGTIVIQPWLI